jgi:hypothetical protein
MIDGGRPEPALADRVRKAVATKDLVHDEDRSGVDRLANDAKRRCRYRS